MTKTCPICGIAFEPTKHGQKYCCTECAKKAKRAAIKASRERINQKLVAERHASWGWNTCAECGRVYKIETAAQKICCSDECRAKRLMRQVKEGQRRAAARRWEAAHPDQGTYEEHLKAKEAEKAAQAAIRELERLAAEAEATKAEDRRRRESAQKRFDTKLKLYAAQGISYGEAQRKETIERFARIDLGKGGKDDTGTVH